MLTAFANGAIFGTRVGVGNPKVLALHGWGGTSKQLLGCLDGLDAISLDLPGFGASPAPDAAWGAADYASAILPILDEFESPPVILGFSFGGRIAVHLAAEFPERVGSLVLTGAPLLRSKATPKAPFKFRLAKWANRTGLLSSARLERERQKRGSLDYRNAEGVMRSVLVRAVNETYEEELKALRAPVEFVWGELDSAAPASMLSTVEGLLAGSVQRRITVVSGEDHFLPVNNPGPIREALRRSLA